MEMITYLHIKYVRSWLRRGDFQELITETVAGKIFGDRLPVRRGGWVLDDTYIKESQSNV